MKMRLLLLAASFWSLFIVPDSLGRGRIEVAGPHNSVLRNGFAVVHAMMFRKQDLARRHSIP